MLESGQAKATGAAVSAASQRARETLALNELKKLLGYRPSALVTTSSNSNSNEEGVSNTNGDTPASVANVANERTTEAYLLRFLRYNDYALPETVAALRRRREFEYTFASFVITPAVVGFLRSGDIAIIGNDHQHRPVLFLNYRRSEAGLLNDVDLQRVAVMLLEYMQSLCIDAGSAAAVRSGRPRTPTPELGKATTQSPSSRREELESAGSLFSPASAAQSSSAEFADRVRQECVLLVKDEGLVRQAQSPVLNTACELAPLLGKYYPNLLGEVLLVQDELEARRSVAAALAGCSPTVRRAVHLVAVNELSKYLDVDILPQELRGRRPARMMASDFADNVLRHWYTMTAYLQLELQLTCPTSPTTAVTTNNSNGTNSKEAGALRRPLYITPPHVVTAPAFAQLQRRSLLGLSENRNSGGALLIPRAATPALYDRGVMNGAGQGGTAAGSSSANSNTNNGILSPAAVMMKVPSARMTANTSSVIEGSLPSRVFTARSAGDITTSAASSFRLDAGANNAANTSNNNYYNNAMTTTTMDDGVCSALSMEDFYDNDDDEEEDEEGAEHTAEGDGTSNTAKGPENTRSPSARLQHQQHHHHNHATMSQPRTASARAMGPHGVALTRSQSATTPLSPPRHLLDAAQPTSEEAERIRSGDTSYGLTLLQQERARRMMAEQKLQMAELGITLDPRTSSAVERRLATIHQELNVLVAEVVVRARAAQEHQAAPTLSQLYDVMLSSLESATGGAPSQSQFLTRGDVVDVEADAAGGCCSCSVM